MPSRAPPRPVHRAVLVGSPTFDDLPKRSADAYVQEPALRRNLSSLSSDVLHSTRVEIRGSWKHMPANVSLVLKSLALAVLLSQTVAAQKAAVPPVTPPRGPFTCTELIGLYSSGEWWDGGFYNGLGDLKSRWQGRFSHYGYTYEYAKPDSYAWSPTNVGGVNNVRL